MSKLFSFVLLLLISFNAYSQSNKVDNDSIILWHNKKLVWNDFQAGKKVAKKELIEHPYAAVTSTGIHIEPFMDSINFVYLKVSAYFSKKESWALDTTMILSDELLKHEQLHFDICELFARKIRARIAQLKRQDKVYELFQNSSSDLRIGIMLLIKEENEMSNLYDKETNHGAMSSQQKRWELYVAGELIKLDNYKYIISIRR